MKVCAVVVTYNPQIDEFIKYCQLNQKEVDYMIVVDNSEDFVIQKKIYELSKKDNIEIIQLYENKGIAYAQNLGVNKAQECSCFDFILFLDQDSMLNEGTISKYKDYYNVLSENNNIACLGVGSTDNKTLSLGTREVKQIISSGSFCPISIFDDVGFMDESLFIDLVEYDWCWRAIVKGYKIFSINEVSLVHKEGEGKVYIFGKRMILPSPIRHYYQYRNFLFLLHKNYVPLEWKIQMLFKMIIKIPIYMLIMDRKFRRLQFILKGIKDYMINQRGKNS